MVNDIMNYLSYLLGLIEMQEWEQLQKVALSNPKTFQVISESIAECEDFNGMTLLHAAVRYDPPIRVLDKMIRLYPSALRGQDCIGRTPLHVAAGCGASSSIIKLLTVGYREACDLQDEDGRTPLHFACDTSCQLFEEDEDVVRAPPSLDTVRVLLAGSLKAVTLEDEDEMNAVEYAIVSDAPIEVVNLLQKASQRVRKQAKSIPRTSSPSPTTVTRLPSPISVQ